MEKLYREDIEKLDRLRIKLTLKENLMEKTIETVERKSKKFFLVRDKKITEVTGLETEQKNAWYVKDIGYTMWIGKHLFDTYDEAKNELLYQIDCLMMELLRVRKELLDFKGFVKGK